MTRDQKIETIYKEIANKELTFGCKYLVSDITDWGDFFTRENEGECLSFRWCSEDLVFLFWEEESKTYKLKEIIGHPVMIGNVIEYLRLDHEVFIEWQPIEDNTVLRRWRDYKTSINNLITLWYRADLPIETQSDECIDYVYSLIQKD